MSIGSTYWTVYMLECKDNSLYTGITNNLDKRIRLHANGKGAKYTRSRGVRGLVLSLPVIDKSTALRLEYRIKQLSKKNKLLMISNYVLNK